MAIETNLDFEMSAFGKLAVPLSYNKFYYREYTVNLDWEVLSDESLFSQTILAY